MLPLPSAALCAALVAGALALGAAAVHAQELPVKVNKGFLTSANGMTLYIYDKDPVGTGVSTCKGPCATNWPPLMAGADDQEAEDFGIITREDGARQWAYKGKPLYLFARDPGPGDKTGDGMNQVWHAAKP